MFFMIFHFDNYTTLCCVQLETNIRFIRSNCTLTMISIIKTQRSPVVWQIGSRVSQAAQGRVCSVGSDRH